jgi:hypothetical protein
LVNSLGGVGLEVEARILLTDGEKLIFVLLKTDIISKGLIDPVLGRVIALFLVKDGFLVLLNRRIERFRVWLFYVFLLEVLFLGLLLMNVLLRLLVVLRVGLGLI